jgi:predicted site-specific integrase-resolvase
MGYVIAKYLRISDEDADMIGKHESNSISNQRGLLDEFIQKMPEYKDCEVVKYFDDGFTGTNFSRPGVRKLIELAGLGEVHCIIVKEPYVKQKLKFS